VDHLERLGASAPTLLLSHAYLRYLGDLYGGQVIRRILAQSYPEHEGKGLAFYVFSGIEDLESFKVAFREAIDAVPESGGDADKIVAEARYGYELHAAMFTELASERAAWSQPSDSTTAQSVPT
jgi:heme oxygenase